MADPATTPAVKPVKFTAPVRRGLKERFDRSMVIAVGQLIEVSHGNGRQYAVVVVMPRVDGGGRFRVRKWRANSRKWTNAISVNDVECRVPRECEERSYETMYAAADASLRRMMSAFRVPKKFQPPHPPERFMRDVGAVEGGAS